MIECNCKVKDGIGTEHEANCQIVLAARLRIKQRHLDDVTRLIPFPGLEAFHQTTVKELQDEVDRLYRRVHHVDHPRRLR